MAVNAYNVVSDDASGSKIDEWELTVGGLLVRRPRLVISDGQNPDASCRVTAQGSLEAAPRTTLFVDDLYGGIDAGLWDAVTGTVNGTGTAATGLLTISTVATTSANAYFLTQRFPVAEYSGTQNIFTCGMRLPTISITANRRRWGVYDNNDGFFFEMNAGTFNVVHRRGAADTAIAAASFSESPGYVLTNTFHRFDIQFTTLGVYFCVDGTLVHKIGTSAITAPMTNTVHLPIRFENVNTGTAGAIATMEVRQCSISRFGGTVGTLEAPGRTQILLQADVQTAAASDTLIAFNKIVGRTVTAITNTAGYIVPAGRMFRLQSFHGVIHASSAVAQSGMIILRAGTGALSTATQPYFRNAPAGRTGAVTNSAIANTMEFPDGFDFPSATAITFSGLAETTAGRLSFSVSGYEF